MSEIILDAEEQVVGRLASRVAKMLLRGESVYIFNAEKALISGKPEFTMKTYENKLDRGDPYHGPFYPKTPEKIKIGMEVKADSIQESDVTILAFRPNN